MRRGVFLFLLVLFAVVIYLVHMVWTLLSLLVVSGAADIILRTDLGTPGNGSSGGREQMIPKIIHQTYKTTSIPAVWEDAQKSCKELHTVENGWEYRLWTDASMDEFIAQEYPWFLDTFRGYHYPIQRADAIRYFVLVHFGGVYIDLDDGCNRPLDPLLGFPAFVRKTVPTGVSNDVLGAVPKHPFFLRVIEELQNYDRSWVLPYITVMASTGPLFVSIIWRHYSSEGLNVGDDANGGRIRILFPKEYMGSPWSFFTHHVGSSWHNSDSDLIFWMSRNWLLLTIAGFAVGGSLLLAVWSMYRRFALEPRSPADLPRWRMTTIRSRLPFWRRLVVGKDYELIDRHEF